MIPTAVPVPTPIPTRIGHTGNFLPPLSDSSSTEFSGFTNGAGTILSSPNPFGAGNRGIDGINDISGGGSSTSPKVFGGGADSNGSTG
jgi:hypothetical protein